MNSIPVYITIDPEVIKRWAERRNGRPATLAGEDRRWPLLFDFGSPSPDRQEIGWERFVAEFERANFAFVYRDTAPDGTLDDFYEFINRAAVPELLLSSQSTIVRRFV